MIREQDLREAIAECQGERNPDARTCMKLAAYYTILNNITGNISNDTNYSRAESPEQVRYKSGSEFAEAIRGLDTEEVLAVVEELMETVSVIMPKLYRATIERLKNM